ncbi:hypothetical protein [Stutzerimonas stutzeri]
MFGPWHAWWRWERVLLGVQPATRGHFAGLGIVVQINPMNGGERQA